jgi:flagellar biosynthesis/type III secretory pathway protein FliH
MPEKTFTQKEYDAYGLDQYLRGIEEGYANGCEDGYANGCEDGYANGIAEGYAKGARYVDHALDSGEWND